MSCSYHHLDLKSFGVVIKFYVTDLTLTSIVALPEDESGFGAGLWTLAARLIEFTDSERGGRALSIDCIARPSVHPIESPGQWKRRRFLFRWRARFFFTPLQPFSLFLLIPRMIQVAMPFFPRGISDSVTTLASVQGQTVIKFNKSRNPISNNRGQRI